MAPECAGSLLQGWRVRGAGFMASKTVTTSALYVLTTKYVNNPLGQLAEQSKSSDSSQFFGKCRKTVIELCLQQSRQLRIVRSCNTERLPTFAFCETWCTGTRPLVTRITVELGCLLIHQTQRSWNTQSMVRNVAHNTTPDETSLCETQITYLNNSDQLRKS